MPSLEVIGLEKRWPGLRVRAEFAVPDGKLLAIVGPSGCGKSTILRMIAGLVKADAGRALVDGRDLGGLPPRERGIGMVFQDYALFPHMNAARNVAYGLAAKGMGRRERLLEAERLLDSVGLKGYGKRGVQELSGGEKQRVALARTLALRPGIVLFDEPLSSLDAALRKRLRSDIRDEQLRFGLTALYVTHDLEEAMAMADRLAIMEGGEVLQCDEPRRLWEAPASARVARFMGCGPCLPLLSLKRAAGGYQALTASGRFLLADGDEQSALPGVDLARPGLDGLETEGGLAGLRLHFERNAARRVTESTATPARRGSGGSFHARCLRADYAGDAVDCLMDAGGERISLRFSRDEAPANGEQCSFILKPGSARLLSER
ncbi:MAG TPA: Fe3+/spermidine/putrescine ABC transporter ATP-binding protein [Spirochaetaceae bacterium]|jgi:ABC-type Fe3+/spermidine/putrescine transport system ATPase subunit|nr:Fe3+/spermidine/putrescine ABC transporter ATP-binding protein [Spirochaetaceae bacterium]